MPLSLLWWVMSLGPGDHGDGNRISACIEQGFGAGVSSRTGGQDIIDQ